MGPMHYGGHHMFHYQNNQMHGGGQPHYGNHHAAYYGARGDRDHKPVQATGFWYGGRFISNHMAGSAPTNFPGRYSKAYWDCLNHDVRTQLRALPVNPLKLNKSLLKMLSSKSSKLPAPTGDPTTTAPAGGPAAEASHDREREREKDRERARKYRERERERDKDNATHS